MTRRKKTELMEWMDAALAADPELAGAVEKHVAEMRVEQERFATRAEQRKAALLSCRSRFNKLLQKLEDEEDIRDARAALREVRRKGTIPWEKAKVELGFKYAKPFHVVTPFPDPAEPAKRLGMPRAEALRVERLVAEVTNRSKERSAGRRRAPR